MPVLNPPSGLSFTQNSVGSIVLKWFPVVGAVSYNIYRRTDSLGLYPGRLNQSAVTVTTFTDLSPIPNQINFYNITTVNASGESFPSQTLAVDLTIINNIGGLPRVDPQINKFRKLISDRGYKMLWQRAQVCSCSLAGQAVTDATDLDHPLCKNKQHIWTNEGIIQCLITRITRKRDLEQDAVWEAGTMMVTTEPENKLGFYDRLIFQEATVPFSEAVKKGAQNGTDNLRFPAIMTDLPIIDFNGNKYTIGVDFSFDGNGNVSWANLSGTQPQTGTPYSVEYETQLRMLIVDYPHGIRGQEVLQGTTVPVYKEFPLQTIGKLEFFIQ